jgi:hypothetical protein
MEKETIYCSYNHIHDTAKDYGMCTNKNSSNYGKYVFKHECEVETLPCHGKKRLDDSVYLDSMLAPDGFTEGISEVMLNIIKFPKHKMLRVWKRRIAQCLWILLRRVAKESENERIVTSVYHNADKILSVLNKNGSIKGYSMEQYQTGRAIHWKLLLEGKEIANTRSKGIFEKLCFNISALMKKNNNKQ